eukprot:7466476-Karenia_brevis.AAC.1
MVVTQTALWCNESWVVTKVEKQHFQAVQHEMLRRIAGPKRRHNEDWLEWVARATDVARERAQQA